MDNVIKRVVIEKLYDIYDYDIDFEVRGGITMITGPNGYGKTTVLNILKNALDLNFWYFYDLLYKTITIYLGDNTVLSFSKVPTGHKTVYQQTLFEEDYQVELALTGEGSDEVSFDVHIIHTDNTGKVLDKTVLNSHKFASLLERVARFRPGRGISFPIEFTLNITPDDTEQFSRMDKELRKQFAELRMFAQEYNALFVREQRMFKTRKRNADEIGDVERYTITHLAERIKELYSDAQKKYADKSQQIDSTFITRQLEKIHEPYSEIVYQEKLERLKTKISEFEKYGLIEKYNLVEVYKKELGATLSMHIDDMFDKFSVYDEFYKKLDRFFKFVNDKGLSNKKLKLDARNGITFMSVTDHVIPLYKLSSGEQNLVILYFRLVFETNSQTLLLLDEPENSMHVEWLEHMLEDYIEMQGILGCQMLIATHSVTFVNGHWDKAYDLYGGSYQDWMEE